MAQSNPEPLTDEPANSILDDLPSGWEIERAKETSPTSGTDVRRELILEHGSGAALLIKGSRLRGFTTYYRPPGARNFDTILKSSLWGRRRIRTFEQCLDRGVLLATRYDSAHDT